MMKQSPAILCVESDRATLQNRCAVLKSAGYDATSASPQLAEILLTRRKFDLIVISSTSEYELAHIINVCDGAQILALDAKTRPPELLKLVAEKLETPTQ